jgi:hypothetical protein
MKTDGWVQLDAEKLISIGGCDIDSGFDGIQRGDSWFKFLGI